MKKALLVLCLAAFCMAQQPQQQTPQQTVSALVSQQTRITADIVSVLNQVPDLVKQVQDLQVQVIDLQEQLKNKDKGKK